MSIFLKLFLLWLILTAGAFEPPPEFCGSISGLCKNHSFCSKTALLDDTPEKLFPRKFEYDSFIRKDFVMNLNHLRDEFACGTPPFTNVEGATLPKAAQMQEVIWDEELEWGADQYASQCIKIADPSCAITPNHRNVAIFFLDQKQASFRPQHFALLTAFYSKLYDPHVLIDLESLKKHTESYIHTQFKDENGTQQLLPFLKTVGGKMPSSRYVESFKTMIHDDVSKIGCATYDCDKSNNGVVNFITACIVDNKNTLGKPIYKESNVGASSCEKVNVDHKCLCATFVPPSFKPAPIPRQTEPHVDKTTPLHCEKVFELKTRPFRKTTTARPIVVVVTKNETKKVTCIKRAPETIKSKALHLGPSFIILIVLLNF